MLHCQATAALRPATCHCRFARMSTTAAPRLPRLVSAAWHHLRHGSLMAALRRRLATQPPNRFSAQTPQQAAVALTRLALDAAQGRELLVIGNGGPYQDDVLARLSAARARCRTLASAAIAGLQDRDFATVGCIVLATLDSQVQLGASLALQKHPSAAAIPLEYIALPQLETAPILQWDRHRDGGFVSPLLGRHGQVPYEIYRESLTRFERKTDVRDYLDLWQILESLETRAVPGNIAEFGSFKGHSGYLMSRVLEHLRSARRLYLFDMFENFPNEDAGIDRFWSGTHRVDFEQVRSKFRDRGNVQLVKGDFTQTLAQTETGDLALAFIDCDSYRATRYLLDYIWSRRLPVGGMVVLEDYGHAALLGNRLAAHEFFDGRRDAYTFFSQFSGFYVAVKLGTA